MGKQTARACALACAILFALGGCDKVQQSDELSEILLPFDTISALAEGAAQAGATSPDTRETPIITYLESEKLLLERSAENGDKPIVGDDSRSARLYVLKSTEQLAEIEALPDLETLYIEISNIDLVLASPTLKMLQFDGEFRSSGAISIDLSGCPALGEVSLRTNRSPRELKLPDSVEELKISNGFVEYADYLSTLPNLRKLTPLKAFDLSLLNGFESLETLVVFGEEWDLSALENEHISALQLDSQEALDSFAGLSGLRSMSIDDRGISDISRAVEYAPELETLTIHVSSQYIGDTEDIWRGDFVDASNVELLDSLSTPIPIEQLKAAVANGTRLAIWCDPNR